MNVIRFNEHQDQKMKFFEKIRPEWPLRIGLGLTYLYSGIDLMRHPTAWYWAIPLWLKNAITQVVDLEVYLRIQGAAELILAFIFLAWFLKLGIAKYAALISTVELAAIVLLALIPFSQTNFLITFRDIGVLGASLSLFIICSRTGREPAKESETVRQF